MGKMIIFKLILIESFKFLLAQNCFKPCISCENFLGNLKNPLAIVSLNQTSILIIEQIGYVRLYNTNDKSMHTLLNLTDKVVYDYSKQVEQRGLLGLAVNPNCFPNCASFYLYYSAPKENNIEDHKSVASRFIVPPSKTVIEEEIILNISQPTDVHNGGQLFFDNEDNLYITVGDSGMRNASFQNTSKLGKILSYNIKNEKLEIYASGFENPWRCDIAPEKGIICADAGEKNEDRISIVQKGDIHGWRDDELLALSSKHKLPIHIHGKNIPSAVIGGMFYNGSRLPFLKNRFLYGDYVDGSLYTLSEKETNEWESEKLNLCHNCEMTRKKHFILSFGQDYLKNVYVLTMARDNKLEGIIYKLVDLDNENVSCDGFLIKPGLILATTAQILIFLPIVITITV